MNEDTITDLKQFITATMSQQFAQQTVDLEQRIEEKLEKKLDEKLDEKLNAFEYRITKKIDDLSAAVAEAMEANTAYMDNKLDDHELRITRLEHRAA